MQKSICSRGLAQSFFRKSPVVVSTDAKSGSEFGLVRDNRSRCAKRSVLVLPCHSQYEIKSKSMCQDARGMTRYRMDSQKMRLVILGAFLDKMMCCG